MTERMKLRTILVLATVAVATLIAGTNLLAATPASGGAPAPGQAIGTFAVGGKTVKLAYAAAFVDQKDDRKPLVLFLTDEQLPSAQWKSEFDLMAYRSDHKFAGVGFWLDKNHEVFRTDYYAPGDPFNTSTSGIFDLKTATAGKTLTGSATSTDSAAHLNEPVKLQVTFAVTLK